MDNAVHNRLFHRLRRRAQGGVVERVQAASEGLLVSYEEGVLFFCLNPEMPFVYPMRQHPASKTSYGHLAGQLSRHMAGRTISRIGKPAGDRIYLFSLEEEGADALTLCFQAFPRNPELVLLDETDHVLVSLGDGKTEDLDELEQQERTGFYGEHSEESILKALEAFCAGGGPPQELQGVTPQMLNALCQAKEIKPDGFIPVLRSFIKSDFGLVIATAGQESAVHELIPAPFAFERSVESYESIDECVQRWFGKEARRLEISRVSKELRGAVKNIRKRARRALKSLKREADDHEKNENLNKWADLILANLHKIGRGDDSVTVEDLYDPGGGEVTIPLDAELSASENAKRFYKQAAKARRAADHLARREKELQRELSHAEALQQEIEQASDDLKALRAMRTRLKKEGLITEKKERQRSRDVQPGRRFKHTSGARIIVGRSSADNDEVTFKVGNDTDFWLHAAGMPGSHVILRNPEKREEPVPIHLELAAGLAAYYSKARNSGNVQVHWTQRRFVKKMKGGQPGKVLLKNYRSVVVDPIKPGAFEVDS